MSEKLTHIDSNNLPTMVDVSSKETSIRMAKAQSIIQLPDELKDYISGDEVVVKKGPVIQTAIIAGTMAVKKTHEVIPFCHQIPVESCKFNIEILDDLKVKIECTVKTSFKTGVEMEALYGASAAALTIYDMCKAVSHNIEILDTKLVSKTGGKRTILGKPLYGLILTGGKSKRMKRDKALIEYHDKPHAIYIYDILMKYCDEVFLSAREGQWDNTPIEGLPIIQDETDFDGPISGISSAMNYKSEDAYWFVVACDLIYFNEEIVRELLASHNSNKLTTAYKNVDKGFAEPLCTIYSPGAKSIFNQAIVNDIKCPVKVLRSLDENLITKLDQGEGISLANINTVEEFKEATNEKR